MRRLFAYCNMLDKPFIQHCEDHADREGEMNSETSTRLGLIGSQRGRVIIDRDLHLLRRTKARYHVAHISTRAGIDAVRKAKIGGWP